MRPRLRDAGGNLDRRNAWHAAGRVGRAGGWRGHPRRLRAPRCRDCRLEPHAAVRGGGDRTRPPVGQPVHIGHLACRVVARRGRASSMSRATRSGSCRSMIRALVDAVLATTGLAGNAPLRAKLLEQFDITTLTAPKFDEYAGGALSAAGRLADHRHAGGRTAQVERRTASGAAAAVGAALLLDRLQPQGGAGRGASADRRGALRDAWTRAQRRCVGGRGGAAQGRRSAACVPEAERAFPSADGSRAARSS